MAAFETVSDCPTGAHVHEAGLLVDGAQCPLCGQPVTRKQYRDIRQRIEREGRERLKEAERTLKERFAAEQQQAAARAKADIDKAKSAAAAEVAKAKRDAAAREVAIRQEAIRAATTALAPKIADAVNAEKQRAYVEKLKLTDELEQMKRRLEKKTAGELGDEAEVDLFEALKREFPGDEVARVPKGRAGGDIIHRVVHNRTVCGTLIYDCKNHQRWLNRFTSKLRQDQVAEQADHAVLVSAVFPAGMQQLAVQDGIVIVHPARATALAHLLRRQTIQMHALRLGNEARAEKTARLYAFMTCDRASQLWDQLGQATNALEALERTERTSHERVWGQRADLIRSAKGVHEEFSTAVDRIVRGTDET